MVFFYKNCYNTFVICILRKNIKNTKFILKKNIMLKKIIITIILLFSIVWNSLADKITFSLDKVDVLSKNVLELNFNKDLKETNFLIGSFKIIDSLENQLLIEKAEIFNKNKVKIFLDKNLELEKNYKITVLELLDIEWNSIKQGYNASLEFITPKDFNILKKDEKTDEKSLEFFKIEEKSLENKNNIKNEKNIENKNVINNKEKEKNEKTKKDVLEKIKIQNEIIKKEKQKQLEKKLKEEKIIKNNIAEKIKSKNKEIKDKLENSNNTNDVIIVDSLPTAWPTETILIILSLLLWMWFFIRKKI